MNRPHWSKIHRSHQSVFERLFVGIHADPIEASMSASLVRVWGYGYDAVGDLVATARYHHPQLREFFQSPTRDGDVAIEVAERTAPLIERLLSEAKASEEYLRAACLSGLGRWQITPLDEIRFEPRCDTQTLSARAGLTIIDDLVSSDQAQGGRGGPLEATGAWMLFGDRGLVPGRVIRAVLELGRTANLTLCPPRQSDRIPSHLRAYDVVPAQSLLDGIMAYVNPDGSPELPQRFDVHELIAVQSKRVPGLAAAWDACLGAAWRPWSPLGIDVTPLLEVLHDWPEPLMHRGGDLLCTAIHWIASRIAQFMEHHLPPSQPIGQLLLAGPLRHHSFLRQQLTQQIPAVTIRVADEVCEIESWRSTASAMLGLLYVDQMPANSAELTGTRSPRVLGRVTAGHPSNWHRVLADMSDTLPDKKTLRSAV